MSVETAIRTAIASKNEASTPTACSRIQLRKICANTATRTKPTTRLPWPSLRSTASPFQSSRPSAARGAAGRRSGRDHRERDDRQPPRQAEWLDQGERRQRRQHPLDGEDRKLSCDQGRTCGLTVGDEWRSAAIRAATPSCPLMRSAQDLHARRAIEDAAATVPPAASMVRCHASLRASSATIWSSEARASTPRVASTRASANSSLRPASTKTRAAWWPASPRSRSACGGGDRTPAGLHPVRSADACRGVAPGGHAVAYPRPT